MNLTKDDVILIDQLRKEAKVNKCVYLLLNTIWGGVFIDEIGNTQVTEAKDIIHDIQVAQLAWEFVKAEMLDDGQGESHA